MSRSIEARASFDRIRYANCWEDAEVLCAALRPVPGKRILSIGSGGDNSFALLAEGAEVVAADLSPAQLALIELKAAAVRRFELEDTLGFLGVTGGGDRLATYDQLRPGLSPRARDYWDADRPAIADGVIHRGKFEGYFRLFRTRVLPWIHRRRTVRELLAERDAAGRRAFYDRTWDNLRWRLLFRLFFGRFAMGRLGRDPEFFRYVEGSVAERILTRCRYALTELPTHDNEFLDYILTGNFGRRRPRYLRPGPYRALRRNLDRLTLFEGPVQEAARRFAGDGFDGFNLSDVFEYLDPETSHGVYAGLLEAARPGARLAYWNMLVPRRCPAELAGRVRALPEAAELLARDRAFFYSAFVLEEVV
jgi:S-adenosylmethionine-diacylglycerol 3-amino-3-carboxypropyl transferase